MKRMPVSTLVMLLVFVSLLPLLVIGQGTTTVVGLPGSTSFPSLAPTQTLGSVTNPNYSFAGAATTGFYGTGDPFLVAEANGVSVARFSGSGATFGIDIAGNEMYGFSPSITTGLDTAMSRISANVIGFGFTASADTSGKLQAAAYMSVGTTFTASGCANSTLVGGATAGTYTSVTAGACTVTITMGNSSTAPHGWICDAHDLTTVADANNVTLGSSTTTTANLVEGTVAANDVIAFKCTGY